MRNLPDVVRAERINAPVAGDNAGNPDIRRDSVSSGAVPYLAAGRPGRLPPFALSLVLGFIVVIAFSMLVYISAFYTLDVSGTRIIVAMVAEFCSGAVIPLPFLPDGARRVLDLLPFASMQSTPFLIWGGSISGTDTLMAIALQIFWAVVLIIAGNLWMRQALKKVVLQGG